MQSGLRRCTRCILPETYPGISFDDEGVCNYCRGDSCPQVVPAEGLPTLPMASLLRRLIESGFLP